MKFVFAKTNLILLALGFSGLAYGGDLFLESLARESVIKSKNLGLDWTIVCEHGNEFEFGKGIFEISPQEERWVKMDREDGFEPNYYIHTPKCEKPVFYVKGVNFPQKERGKVLVNRKHAILCQDLSFGKRKCDLTENGRTWSFLGKITSTELQVKIFQGEKIHLALKGKEENSMQEPSWGVLWAGLWKERLIVLMHVSRNYVARNYYLLVENKEGKLEKKANDFRPGC